MKDIVAKKIADDHYIDIEDANSLNIKEFKTADEDWLDFMEKSVLMKPKQGFLNIWNRKI